MFIVINILIKNYIIFIVILINMNKYKQLGS